MKGKGQGALATSTVTVLYCTVGVVLSLFVVMIVLDHYPPLNSQPRAQNL